MHAAESFDKDMTAIRRSFGSVLLALTIALAPLAAASAAEKAPKAPRGPGAEEPVKEKAESKPSKSEPQESKPAAEKKPDADEKAEPKKATPKTAPKTAEEKTPAAPPKSASFDPYQEYERLSKLERIRWSAKVAARYPNQSPVAKVADRVWEHLGSVSGLAFSPDSRLALTGSWKEARLYDVETGKQLNLWKHKRPSYVIAVAFSPDGKTAATGAGDGTTRLWNVESGEMLRQWGHWKDVEDLDFSPDGRYVATTAADRTAKLWDTESGEKVFEMSHKATVLPLDFTPDGTRLMTGSMDNMARLWDLKTGNAQFEWKHDGQVGALDVSPDGKYGLTGAADGTARLVDLESGDETHIWKHKGTVYDVHFSPDSKYAVTAGADKVARMWDVETKKLVHTFQHDSLVAKSVFSPDGHYVMTGASDNKARLWVVESGKMAAEWVHGDGVRSIVFSKDGRLVLTGSFDKTARLFDLGAYFGVESAAFMKKRLDALLRYNVAHYAGAPPPTPIITPRGENENESTYARRITANKKKHERDLGKHAAKAQQFPVWRRNQIVEYAFFSVFGRPVIKSTRYDSSDSRFIVEIASDSPIAGGVTRNIVLDDPVPPDNVRPMKEAIEAGTPAIDLKFDGKRLVWERGWIETGGRVYRGEIVDDPPDGFDLFEAAKEIAEKPEKSG